MDEPNKSFAPELSAAGSRKWIGRLIVAVVAGLAVWNFVVSLTSHVVIPALARVLPADPQSPFYLGAGDYNVAAFFTSVLELCFAAIAAALVSSATNRHSKPARRKAPVAIPSKALPLAAPAGSPIQMPVSQAAPAPAAEAPKPANSAQQPAAQPQTPAKPAQSARPKSSKKVYYNLVGEAVESDEDQ
jgi:hypothetical protein